MNRLLSLLLITLLSCSDNEPLSSEYNFRYGQSWGFCVGYCNSELSFSDGEAIIIQQSNNDKRDKKLKFNFASEDYRQLVELFDQQEFDQLPTIIGCPDCADGGAEFLEVKSDGEWRKVTFEYNNAPESIATLVSHLREFHNSRVEEW